MSPLQYIDVSKASAWPGQNIWKGAKATAQALLPQSLSCSTCHFQLAVSPIIWTRSNNLLTKGILLNKACMQYC